MNTQALFDRADALRVPDYGLALVRQSAVRTAMALDRGEKEEEIRAELANEMEQALEGNRQFVPSYTTNIHNQRREKLETVIDAVMESLDYGSCGEGLLAVLVNSECPLVAALKESLIDAYVKLNASGVIEARME